MNPNKIQSPKAAAENKPATPQTRWEALGERLDNEGFLDGKSEEVKHLLAECRLIL